MLRVAELAFSVGRYLLRGPAGVKTSDALWVMGSGGLTLLSTGVGSLVMEGNGSAARDHAAWVEEGAALGREMRMQEEDVLAMLSMEPSRAADAMVSLFEETLDRIEHPLPIEDGLTSAEVAQLREEQREALTRFWRRCDELARMIAGHPARPRPS